jgi:hypothetical protein
MYAWASALALVLSFATLAIFVEAPSLRLAGTQGAVAAEKGPRFVGFGRVASVTLLLLCIATGLFGTNDPYQNFNMTFFWIIFVLAVPYATLMVGDFYSAINPWWAMVAWLDSKAPGAFAGRLQYPKAVAYYPALLFYMAFIWLELFGELSPRGLSLALVAYSMITLGGSCLFGHHAWFQHAEFFNVFLRLIGYVAPRRGRWPFAGLSEVKAEHPSLLLFILFMLSSTAFDGLHETYPWVQTYWNGVYPLVSSHFSADPRASYEQALFLYKLWQWFWLAVAPFVYLCVLWLFMTAARLLTKSQCTAGDLCLRFALSLIPIAVAYHITHYYPTLLVQGPQIVRLISDPFGFGWNLFGTAGQKIPPIMVGVGVIWMSQVVLIVAGHIVSGYLAHVEALRSFPNSRQATLSQLPILLLMVLFTTSGLKILSMPLAS